MQIESSQMTYTITLNQHEVDMIILHLTTAQIAVDDESRLLGKILLDMTEDLH